MSITASVSKAAGPKVVPPMILAPLTLLSTAYAVHSHSLCTLSVNSTSCVKRYVSGQHGVNTPWRINFVDECDGPSHFNGIYAVERHDGQHRRSYADFRRGVRDGPCERSESREIIRAASAESITEFNARKF